MLDIQDDGGLAIYQGNLHLWSVTAQNVWREHRNAPSVLWHNAETGELSAWAINDRNGSVLGAQTLAQKCLDSACIHGVWFTMDINGDNNLIVGTGDFSGDGRGDILSHDANTGRLIATLTNGTGASAGTVDVSMRCGRAPKAASDTTPWADGGPGCAAAWRPVGLISPARY